MFCILLNIRESESSAINHSSRGWVWVSHCGSNLRFLNGNDIEHFLMTLLATCSSFTVKCLQVFGLSFIVLLLLLFIGHQSSFHTLHAQYLHCTYFLPFCGLPVYSLDGTFWWTDIFNCDKIQITFLLCLFLSVFSLSCLCLLQLYDYSNLYFVLKAHRNLFILK